MDGELVHHPAQCILGVEFRRVGRGLAMPEAERPMSRSAVYG